MTFKSHSRFAMAYFLHRKLGNPYNLNISISVAFTTLK